MAIGKTLDDKFPLGSKGAPEKRMDRAFILLAAGLSNAYRRTINKIYPMKAVRNV
jgi:hypothetical protein